MEGIVKGLGAIIVTVLGGLALWWLTTNANSPFVSGSDNANGVSTTAPRSFMERLAGDYELISWNRAPGPIDLGVGVKNGTLEIDAAGNADWSLGIWDRAANPNTPATAPSRIRCGGRVSSQMQQITWVSGGDRNEAIDWEDRLMGLYTDVWITFCGGQSAGGSAPFGLSLDEQSNGNVLLEMSNSEGTFRWVKES